MADKRIREILSNHLTEDEYVEALACYSRWEHIDWITTTSFISYFHLDNGLYDMIITAAKDNKFTPTQFKILKKTIENRDRALIIASDSTNKTLRRWVEKKGGFFKGETMVFL